MWQGWQNTYAHRYLWQCKREQHVVKCLCPPCSACLFSVSVLHLLLVFSLCATMATAHTQTLRLQFDFLFICYFSRSVSLIFCASKILLAWPNSTVSYYCIFEVGLGSLVCQLVNLWVDFFGLFLIWFAFLCKNVSSLFVWFHYCTCVLIFMYITAWRSNVPFIQRHCRVG